MNIRGVGSPQFKEANKQLKKIQKEIDLWKEVTRLSNLKTKLETELNYHSQNLTELDKQALSISIAKVTEEWRKPGLKLPDGSSLSKLNEAKEYYEGVLRSIMS